MAYYTDCDTFYGARFETWLRVATRIRSMFPGSLEVALEKFAENADVPFNAAICKGCGAPPTRYDKCDWCGRLR